MTIRFPNSGLYAITNQEKWPGSSIIRAVSMAIDGGAKAIQYREKNIPPKLTVVRELASLCRSRKVPFIINDDIELAHKSRANGVHLGENDSSIKEAKRYLGNASIVGASCYNSLDRAHRAQRDGANYIAFGRFFPSKTKPGATPVDTRLLNQANFEIPVAAIGGITPENGRILLEAGANLLAVTDGVFGQRDPKIAALAYGQLFATSQI